MTIGKAIEAIKQGKKAARRGWNGKNQFIFLAKNITYSPLADISHDNMKYHETMGDTAIVFCGTSGIQVGWLASQSDLLSEDWVIIDG